MAFEVSQINNYGYMYNASASNNALKLVHNNAQPKSANPGEAFVQQQQVSTNSALLFEYTQSIAKSNIAQQLVLDNNLKETLKFLNSEAAKKWLFSDKKRSLDVIEAVLTENGILGYDTKENEKEDENLDVLELFDIKIDNSKKNIFAA